MEPITTFLYPSIFGISATIVLTLLLLVCCIRWRHLVLPEPVNNGGETYRTEISTVSSPRDTTECRITNEHMADEVTEVTAFEKEGPKIFTVGSYEKMNSVSLYDCPPPTYQEVIRDEKPKIFLPQGLERGIEMIV